MGSIDKTWLQAKTKSLVKSVWFFPCLCFLVVLLMASLKISGSSVGVYQQYIYGKSEDSSLLLNKPRPVRSDEWLVNTQMTLAQKNAGYPKVNQNIGGGEDMSVILDVPVKDWSTLFRPQNWSFFVMPFDYAFAFKWWLMSFLLVTSCYFFVLALLPGRRLLAALLSLGLLFSPFVQWWYQYITLAPLYYSLALMTVFVYLLRSKKLKTSILIGAAGAYFLVSFILVLYPPFQIACGLAATAFMAGYCVQYRNKLSREQWLKKSAVALAAVVVALSIVGLFAVTRQEAIKSIKNTVYPGHRTVIGSGFEIDRLATTQLAFILQFSGKAASYSKAVPGAPNQSEASSFIFILPFLLLPSFLLLYKNFKQKFSFDWALAATLVLFFILTAHLFVKGLDGLFRLLLLNQVPHNRLLIGLGLLGIINLVLVIQSLGRFKKLPINKNLIAAYCLLVFILEVTLALHLKQRAPGFISLPLLLLLSIPIPVALYALLTKRFQTAAAVLLGLSFISCMGIHPLYRGTGTISKNPASLKIQELSKNSRVKWVAEETLFENFASLNGAPSLSGTYSYPQLKLWQPLDPDGLRQDVYNRYAHVVFKIDRQPGKDAPTDFFLRAADNVVVTTEPCSKFLASNGVGYLLTLYKLNGGDDCASLVGEFSFPATKLYIYHLTH